MLIIPKTENIINIPINPQTKCFLLSVLMFSSEGFNRYLTIPYRKRTSPKENRKIITGFINLPLITRRRDPTPPDANATGIKLKYIELTLCTNNYPNYQVAPKYHQLLLIVVLPRPLFQNFFEPVL